MYIFDAKKSDFQSEYFRNLRNFLKVIPFAKVSIGICWLRNENTGGKLTNSEFVVVAARNYDLIHFLREFDLTFWFFETVAVKFMVR